MSEELIAKTRTRLGLKSCLRNTPPITPEDSVASSPCNSGRTSPSIVSDCGSSVSSCCARKTVSFCSDNQLEEIFWADEWDRTPTAVTPKLSYQDVLELKQLRVTAPFSPLALTSAQPFTTSTPPPSKQPFPVSRFASATSHTPSKWKNRSEPQRTDVDPEILPYLDAVPIRLLPLLPQSPTESDPPAQFTQPDPHPQTPTPTASPETRPTIKPPFDLPELNIELAKPVSVTSPPSRPKPSFAFVPLLPIPEPPPVPPTNIQSSPMPPPRRKFNMTFLPVNAAPEEASSLSSVSNISPTAQEKVDVWIGSTVNVPPPSIASSSIPSDDAVSFPLVQPLSPDTLSLPVSESDNETESDVYTDTDGESDAPSSCTYGSSLPSSPPCEYEDDMALQDLNIASEADGYYPRIHTATEAGSYFPRVMVPVHEPKLCIPAHVLDVSPTHSSGPGQTPPLSVLYPSPTSRTRPLSFEGIPLPSSSRGEAASLEDVVHPPLPAPTSQVCAILGSPSLPMTPMSLSHSLQKKLVLEALPSPALVPPSPFELEPHTGIIVSKDAKVQAVTRPDATPTMRANASAPNTLEDLPTLTLGTVRVAWDTRARPSIAMADISKKHIVPTVGRSWSS